MSEYALALDEVELQRYRMMAELARSAEADLWELAGITSGARVADVGCGPGGMLPALADAVAPDGTVTAIDADSGAVAAARALAAGAGLANVTVEQGSATDTGIPQGSQDAVMMRHVLAHNGGSEDAIVAHLASLVRPGGHVYLVDADGTGMATRPEDPELTDLNDRYQAFHTARGNDMRAGLRLGERLADAGLEVVEFRGSYIIRPVPPGVRPPGWAARDALVRAGVATADDVARWGRAFERVDAMVPPPTFFAPMFVAVGRKAQTPA